MLHTIRDYFGTNLVSLVEVFPILGISHWSADLAFQPCHRHSRVSTGCTDLGFGVVPKSDVSSSAASRSSSVSSASEPLTGKTSATRVARAPTAKSAATQGTSGRVSPKPKAKEKKPTQAQLERKKKSDHQLFWKKAIKGELPHFEDPLPNHPTGCGCLIMKKQTPTAASCEPLKAQPEPSAAAEPAVVVKAGAAKGKPAKSRPGHQFGGIKSNSMK